MKAGFSRRLVQAEKLSRAKHPKDLGGSIEIHHTEANGADRERLPPCQEHGPACGVDVIPLPHVGVKRIIISSGEPWVLG